MRIEDGRDVVIAGSDGSWSNEGFGEGLGGPAQAYFSVPLSKEVALEALKVLPV